MYILWNVHSHIATVNRTFCYKNVLLLLLCQFHQYNLENLTTRLRHYCKLTTHMSSNWEIILLVVIKLVLCDREESQFVISFRLSLRQRMKYKLRIRPERSLSVA